MDIGRDVSLCAADGRVKRLVLRSLGARGITAHVKAVLWRDIQRDSDGERTCLAEDVEEIARRLLKTNGSNRFTLLCCCLLLLFVVVVITKLSNYRDRCSPEECSVSRNVEVRAVTTVNSCFCPNLVHASLNSNF